MEKNIPKLRFPGFTDAWEQRKFEECYKISSGYSFKYLDYCQGGLPLINGESIQHGRIDDGNLNYLPKSFADDYSEFILHEKDIVVGLNRPITNGSLKIARIPDKYEGSLLYQRAGKIHIKNNIDKDFSFILLSKEILEFTLKEAVGSDQPFISTTKLDKWEMCFPSSYKEQSIIGSFFMNLDNLITLQQRKCDEIKNLKKCMLQKMFPKEGEQIPEIRFPRFTDNWEQRKLEDFGKATGGTSIESEFSEDGKYKVISIGSYSEDSIYRDQGIRAIDSEKTKKRVLNKGDLTMILNDKTASGNIIGRVLLVEESGVYVYNQRTERIEIDFKKYDSLFIYEMLNAPSMREKIILQAQGNTQIYVNWSNISLTEYLIPSLPEQKKIGEFFANLDNIITLQQRKLESIKEFKKSLLQQMFI